MPGHSSKNTKPSFSWARDGPILLPCLLCPHSLPPPDSGRRGFIGFCRQSLQTSTSTTQNPKRRTIMCDKIIPVAEGVLTAEYPVMVALLDDIGQGTTPNGIAAESAYKAFEA